MPYVRGVATGDSPADVAELVDALVSGTSGSNVVGVQVSPSASQKPLPFGRGFLVLNRALIAATANKAKPKEHDYATDTSRKRAMR